MRRPKPNKAVGAAAPRDASHLTSVAHPGRERVAAALGPALLDWHARCGRHDLPWQRERTPYRVWVSEIMLQQTQVVTVAPYFERFMRRFPDVGTLAAAPLDEVLHEWTGLGYYARARNLHRAARRVCEEFGGVFPQTFAEVADLPGIGRSTAGAILALALDQRQPILDGNVKRVLSRVFGIEGHAAERRVELELWSLAEACTPQQDVATYTQAIMDLGATLCTRQRPGCDVCPLSARCSAQQTGRQSVLPAPKPRAPRAARRREQRWMLLAANASGAVLLERRPARGLWGGLWSLPEFTSEEDCLAFAEQRFDRGLGFGQGRERPPQRLGAVAHAFTHFDLTIYPLLIAPCEVRGVMEPSSTLWYNPRHAPDDARVGLPAPVKTLLDALATANLQDLLA